MATSPFDGLKPESLWKHFENISKIPHCSKNEEALAKHVLEWAKSKGFEAEQDEVGNVVVRVPASKGKEKVAPVVIQGHLDMVGEKDSDSKHDFDKDPIPVIRDGEYLTADGTTLGADNAVGLAAGMALADDELAIHGPVELLFTVDEETGLTGAQALKAGFVKGKTMLNLDSEEEGAVYVGCAGGADTVVDLPLERAAGKGDAYQVKVSGFMGGHSGLDINSGRGNAVEVLGWYLQELRESVDFGLVSFDGGDKHNAIPREATAVISLEADAKAKELIGVWSKKLETIYSKTDSGGKIELSKSEASDKPLTAKSRDTFMNLLTSLPHGVFAMSQAVEGLVETSTNLAVAKIGKDQAHFEESSRSFIMPSIVNVQHEIMSAAKLAGAKPEASGGYPGWQPDMDSKVLERAKIVHEKLFGKAPEVKAIHAGLECGIIGEKFGDMDMLSFGPQIEWPHSPSERIKIDTVDRFYTFVKGILEDLAS